MGARMENLIGKNLHRVMRPTGYLLLDCLGAATLYYLLYLTIVHLVLGDFTPQMLTRYTVTGAVVLIFRLLVYQAGYDQSFRTGVEITHEMRQRLANHMKELSMGYFDKRGMGYLLNTLTGDVCQFEGILTHAFPFFLRTCALGVFMVAGTFFIDIHLALLQLVVVGVSLPVLALGNRRLQKHGAGKRRIMEQQVSVVMEFLDGVKVFQSHNMTEQGFTRMMDSLEKMKTESIRAEKSLALFSCLYGTVTGMIFPLVLMLGGYRLLNGQLAPTAFIAFMIMGVSLTVILGFFEHYYLMLKDLSLAVENIDTVFRYAPLPYGNHTGNPVDQENPDVVFDHVCFSYSGGKEVIYDISFRANAGSKTALIGPSGSGKTTIASLIARFYDPTRGTVYIGGKPIREIHPDNVLGLMAEVFQENILFEDTIWNNVKIANPNAPDREIEKALADACCGEFAQKLPYGYHTLLAQGGIGLSGGEKQRIAIARAILKDAPILLLDESTASLDADNESRINGVLDRLMAQKTVFVIAHRLNTIRNADRILLLKDGEIEEMGTHRTLMKQKGHYFKMVTLHEKSCNWTIKEERR